MSSKKSATRRRKRYFSLRRKRGFRFPLREGNRLQFSADADDWFDAALASIDAAQCYILFEIYLISDGEITARFTRALCTAAERGIAVYVLIDDYGGRGLGETTRRHLRTAGVQLRFYNPFRHWRWLANLRRDHRKLLLVDGERAFVTGAGLTDDFSRRVSGEDWWRDTALCISGPVVTDCYQLFAESWRTTGGTLAVPLPAEDVLTGGSVAQLLSARPGYNEIARALIRHVRRARQRIWLTTPYFVPTRKLQRALKHAARRGVEVRLLLPGDDNDHPWVSYAARGRYQRLLHHGVRIFEFQPGFTHAKMALIDDWATAGSSNFDRWDQRWNLDANLAFSDGTCLGRMRDWFEGNFARCEEISLSAWQRRPWHRRLKEWLARLLINLLERIGRNRKRR